MAGGKKIEIIKASSDAKPDVAVNATRKLVEQDKVQIMVGPLSGGEGIAVKDYSKTQPERHLHQRRLGRAGHHAGQPVAELLPLQHRRRAVDGGPRRGRARKGYKKMMLIAEDYAFPYSQVQGFMAEYCKAGRQGAEKAWVPLGSKDYSSVIARIPKDVDALLVVLGGADAVNFLNQYEQAGGDKPMVGGSITVEPGRPQLQGQAARIAARHAVGRSDRRRVRRRRTGRSSSPTTRRTSRTASRARRCSPIVYYINMKAALDGLDAVKGDLSDGQASTARRSPS